MDVCRYCLENEPKGDLIVPCSCNGSVKFVHKGCLLKWLRGQSEQVVIPGLFQQHFDPVCELCHFKYRVVYNQDQTQLRRELAKYTAFITFFLLCSYFTTGIIAKWLDLSLLAKDSEWNNVVVNGFIWTHFILGLFYLIMLISNSNRTCILVGGCDQRTDKYCLWAIVIIGIVGTILCMFIDVLSRVKKRNKQRQITDILSNEEVEEVEID